MTYPETLKYLSGLLNVNIKPNTIFYLSDACLVEKLIGYDEIEISVSNEQDKYTILNALSNSDKLVVLFTDICTYHNHKFFSFIIVITIDSLKSISI